MSPYFLKVIFKFCKWRLKKMRQDGLHKRLMVFKVLNLPGLIPSHDRQLTFNLIPWKNILTKRIFNFFNTFAHSMKAIQALNITSGPAIQPLSLFRSKWSMQYQTIHFWSFYAFSAIKKTRIDKNRAWSLSLTHLTGLAKAFSDVPKKTTS